MKQNINLKLGWNLVGFTSKNINLKNLIEANENILEIKNEKESYNRNVDDIYNSLKELNNNSGYWVKVKKDFNLTIYDNEIIYDFVIVGAGPAGCMLSKVLSESEKFKNKKILLLEKGGNDILENYNKNYRDLTKWNEAMNDPLNSYAITDKFTDFKTIWLGQGLGGGTLHFGMQYIDQSGLYADIPKVKYYLDGVNKITKTERFDYKKEDDNLWRSVYDLFSNDKNINFYNNKIYSRDISALKRFIAYDLISENNNIEIKTNSNVKEVIFEYNIAKKVLLNNNEKIKFHKLILTSGAIENVKILNNSKNFLLENLEIGKTIFDHAGVNLYYAPLPTNKDFQKFIEIGHLQIRSKNLKWQIYFSKVPNVPVLVITIAQAKKVSNNGYVKFNGDQHNIFIEYFNEFDKIETLLDAYKYVDNKMNQIGFINTEQNPIDKRYISDNHNSIFHYHGTCPFDKVVDESQKVKGIDNLYIGDISVLENCVPGSTSVASMSMGYRLGKILDNPEIINLENQLKKLELDNKKLLKKQETYYTIEKLRRIWKEQNKMFVVIQNDGTYVGIGDKKVYDMGNYWKGGGHTGGSLIRFLESENYDFTDLLSRRHGSYSANRLNRGGAVEVGLLNDGSIDKQIKDNNKLIEEILSKNF